MSRLAARPRRASVRDGVLRAVLVGVAVGGLAPGGLATAGLPFGGVTLASASAANPFGADPRRGSPQTPETAPEPRSPSGAGGEELLDQAQRAFAEGESERAIDEAGKARQWFRAADDPSGRFFATYLSAYYHHSLERLDDAARLSREALDDLDAWEASLRHESAEGDGAASDVGAETDVDGASAFEEIRRSRSACHSMLADALRRTGSFERALEHYDEALRLVEEGPARERAAYLADRGLTLFDLARFEAALECYREALEVARASEEDWAARSIRVTRMNRAQVYERIGEIDQARSVYAELLAELDAGEDDPALRANVVTSLGRVHHTHLGDPRTAMGYFEDALEAYRRIGSGAAIANALTHRAYALLSLGRREEALASIEEALALARRAGETREICFELVYRGRCLEALERFDEALASHREAERLAEDAGFPEGRIEALAGLARTHRRRGETGAARTSCRTALALLEDLRERHVPGRSRPRFFGFHQDPFGLMLELLVDGAATGGAATGGAATGGEELAASFDIAQRARARSLLDRLGAEPIDLDTARERLVEPGEAIIEYVFTGRRMIGFAIESGRPARLFSVPAPSGGGDTAGEDPAELARRVQRARDAWLGASAAPNAERELAALGRDVLGPWIDELGPETRSLTIVPDGPLVSLPFSVLPIPGGSGERLVERFRIDVAPSSSAPGPSGTDGCAHRREARGRGRPLAGRPPVPRRVRRPRAPRHPTRPGARGRRVAARAGRSQVRSPAAPGLG